MELHVRILTGNNSNALVQQDLVALLAKMLVSMNLSKIFEQLGGGTYFTCGRSMSKVLGIIWFGVKRDAYI